MSPLVAPAPSTIPSIPAARPDPHIEGGTVKVWIDVGDSKAELGNEGITLHIADNGGKKVGRLRIGRATVEWMPGRTSKNGRTIPLERLIDDVLSKLPVKP
jgi:hypothetical protein